MIRKWLLGIVQGGSKGIAVEPRDTIIVTAQENVSQEDASRLALAIKEKFPDNEVLIVSTGIAISALRIH